MQATNRTIVAGVEVNLLRKMQMIQAIAVDRTLTLSANRVMLRLINHHNCHTSQCNPGFGTLMKALGLSRTMVINAVNELRLKGYVTVKPGGGRQSNAYIIHWDMGDQVQLTSQAELTGQAQLTPA